MAATLVLFSSLVLCLVANAVGRSSGMDTSARMLPAVMVFGDSIVDPGNNNNNFATFAKSNYPPYGIDFAGHQPTGRFSNGKIPTDLIVSKVGIKELLPAYLDPSIGPQDLLTGVSFASGGAGYDPLTSQLASVISLDGQLDLFREYKQKITAFAGGKRAAEIIGKSLYVVCLGSNDVSNTYFATPLRKEMYDMNSYAELLRSFASSFYQELINLGARKIVVVSLPPIGCVPSQRTLGGGISRNCASALNQLASLFNSKLKSEIQRLNSKYQEVQLVYTDIYTILLDMIRRPTRYGFGISTKGCCGTGKLEVTFLCNNVTSWVCNNISEYVFWDSYHPTQAAYEILVDIIYDNISSLY